jgi:hypothetical protein
MSKNYTMEQVLDAVSNSAGVMEYVAVKLNCDWKTARSYVQKWEETQDAFANSECKLHTLAYKSFHKAIADGERWAVERILDTSARRNGHGIVEHIMEVTPPTILDDIPTGETPCQKSD